MNINHTDLYEVIKAAEQDSDAAYFYANKLYSEWVDNTKLYSNGESKL